MVYILTILGIIFLVLIIISILMKIFVMFKHIDPSLDIVAKECIRADAIHYDDEDDFDYPVKPNKHPLYHYIEISGRGAVSVPIDRLKRSKGYQRNIHHMKKIFKELNRRKKDADS